MEITRGTMRRGVQIGIAAGLIVASAVTAIDYRRNPGGVFHGETGVRWSHVLETWVSWFMPVTLLVAVFAVLVLLSLSRWSRGGRKETGNVDPG